jgi:hypothetical protein
LALVYKFYPLTSAIRNLQQRRLKVSLIHELNDPFEFRPYRIRTPVDRVKWEKMRMDLWRNKGLISFTSNWHHPLMWSHYAEKHSGLALGLEIPDDKLFKVRYRTRREALPSLLDVYSTGQGSCFEEAALIKHSNWRYEAEARIFLNLDPARMEMVDIDGSATAMYFEPMSSSMSLREIVIGPACNCSSNDLREIVGREVKIVTSRLAFRSFQVVEQQNPRYHK